MNQLIEREFGIRRLMLVASQLRINHPTTGRTMALAASAGKDFDRVRELLQLDAEPGLGGLIREGIMNQYES